MATARTSRPPSDAAGCYGLRLLGVDGARELLVDAPPEWPTFELRRNGPAGDAPAHDDVGPERATLPLYGGWVAIERNPGRATFHLHESPPDRDLVHPYLAPAAAVAARWAGRESFHGGAVIVDGGAWVVLGEKENGKSTTLAWLALAGHEVLADDLVVVDGDFAMAGPRCIDLRGEPAERLGSGEPLGIVGVRERWRLTLGPVAARVPLRGWITLVWADAVAMEPLRGHERMLALLPHRSVRLAPGTPQALIDLSSLPVWQLSRPRRWSSLPVAGARLLEAIGS